MTDLVPLIISILALLTTFYQLHLQRIHNEKSLKPLLQIDLTDRNGVLSIRIQNNGVGPFIVETITFFNDNERHHRVQDCLKELSNSYDHIDVNPQNKKIINAGAYLEVFSKEVEKQHLSILDSFRSQLTSFEILVEGMDIYSNRVSIKKGLSWFTRHAEKKTNDN